MKLSYEQFMMITKEAPNFFGERWGSALSAELTEEQIKFTEMIFPLFFNLFDFTTLPPQKEEEVKVYLCSYNVARSGNRDYMFIMKLFDQDIERFLKKYGIYN